MRNGWVAPSWEEAAKTFGAHAAEELRFYFRQGIFVNPEFPTEASITPSSISPHLVLGTPQQCVEQLERYHEEFNVDYFTIRLRMPRGPSMAETADQILQFGEEVVQQIHKKYPASTHPAIPAGSRW
jgi:alkanesulfonate monooxygenase SsuD/methylene tetrahydromethanopterin reductase-like flavin-dependent oxidoreductase (luciferase family)